MIRLPLTRRQVLSSVISDVPAGRCHDLIHRQVVSDVPAGRRHDLIRRQVVSNVPAGRCHDLIRRQVVSDVPAGRRHGLNRRQVLAAAVATVAARSSSAQSPTIRQHDGFLSVLGRHVELTTDTGNVDLSRQMVETFDSAVPQWLRMWGQPAGRADDFQIRGYWMRAADRFVQNGWLPPETPPFEFGYSSPTTIWCHEQPSDYYNRHLLMHEGVHAAALNCFGGIGPAWYGEGTAEWLATHRMGPSGLQIASVPDVAADAEHWGRISIVRRAAERSTIPSLAEVMSRPGRIDGDVEIYTWFWLAALLWTAQPSTRAWFLAMTGVVNLSEREFNRRLYEAARDRWPQLLGTWRLLTELADFGLDTALHLPVLAGAEARDDGQTHRLSLADHGGWQAVGVWFPAGSMLQIEITGRNRIDDWMVGPGGDAEQRYRGRALGQVVAAELPIANPPGDRLPPLEIRPVTGWVDGEALIDRLDDAQRPWTARLTVQQPSWLVFKVNRPLAAPNHDGSGAMVIEIRSQNS